MRWFVFAVIVLVTLVLQIGVGRIFGLGPQKLMPDLLLILAIIMAFRARIDNALIACWILGLLKDLTSQAVLGSYAFAFGMIALIIVRLRDMFYGDRLLPAMVSAFIAVCLVEHFALLVLGLRGYRLQGQYSSVSVSIFLSALLTGALLPYARWLIYKFQRHLGFTRRH